MSSEIAVRMKVLKRGKRNDKWELVPVRRPVDMPSGIYLIAPSKSKWPIKVGISTDPIKRCADLQVAHWDELVIVRFWACRSQKHALQIEQATHRLLEFEEREMRGEWFDVTIERAAEAICEKAKELGISLLDQTASSRFDRYKSRI